jgi:hypothetical protein
LVLKTTVNNSSVILWLFVLFVFNKLLLTVASHINKTDHHSINELLLTVALSTNKSDHHSITELLVTVYYGGHFY